MFYVLSKIFDVFLMPLSWAVVLIAYGAPLTRRALRKRRVRPLACLLGLLILVVFSLEPTANALFGGLEAKAVRTMDPAKHYDAVIATRDDFLAIAEDIRDTVTFFADVERHANRLDHRRHQPFPFVAAPFASAKTWSKMDSARG